jgi:hypothetical protein
MGQCAVWLVGMFVTCYIQRSNLALYAQYCHRRLYLIVGDLCSSAEGLNFISYGFFERFSVYNTANGSVGFAPTN